MTVQFGQSIPSSFQHGFRKNHSTSTAALTIQSNIAKGLDRGKKVIVVSTDMSAAFDLLDKEILIPRLLKLGIPKNITDIYEEFLSDRKAWDRDKTSMVKTSMVKTSMVKTSITT